MITDYNINDTVYVPAIVREIHVSSEQPVYTVALDRRGESFRLTFPESEIKGKRQLIDVEKLIEKLESSKENCIDPNNDNPSYGKLLMKSGYESAIEIVKTFCGMEDQE